MRYGRKNPGAAGLPNVSLLLYYSSIKQTRTQHDLAHSVLGGLLYNVLVHLGSYYRCGRRHVMGLSVSEQTPLAVVEFQ